MSLTGKRIQDTYLGLLNVNGNNQVLDTSAQSVKDGFGNTTPLALATNKVIINGNQMPTSAGTTGQVLTTDGAGNFYFATVAGDIDFQNFDQNIIPDQDQVRDLGSPSKQWRDIYVGPGSLYVNGQQVLSDNSGTIVVQADINQNLSIKTTGTGNLELAAEGTGALTFKSDINIQNGVSFYSTNAEIDFGDAINMNGNRIKELAAPISANDAVRKADLDAITLAYTPLNRAGDTMSGNLNMGGNRIVSVSAPIAGTDVANKNYVDNAIAGLSWKDSVLAATTAQITRSGQQTIDGVALVSGNRVLVKNQTDQTANGIFEVRTGAWVRASDADNTPDNEIGGGTAVFVAGGTVNADTGWVIVSPNGTALLETDDIVFTQFTGGTTYADGDGIDIAGNIISVDNTVVRTSTLNGLGDIRYARLSATNTFVGQIIVNNTSPTIILSDSDSAVVSASRTYINRNSSSFTIQTGDVSSAQIVDYEIGSIGIGGAGFHQFRVSAQVAATISPAGTSVPLTTTIITGEKGDVRYAQIAGNNTLTGSNKFTQALTLSGNPVLRFISSTQPANQNHVAFEFFTGDMYLVNRNDAGDNIGSRAIFEVSNASASFAQTVITREKGDARYAQLSAANTLTGRTIYSGIGGQNAPTIEFTFKTEGQGAMGIYSVPTASNSNQGDVLRFAINGALAGDLYDHATLSAPSQFAIMTRSKSDARYAQLSAANIFTSNILTIKGGAPYLQYIETDSVIPNSFYYTILSNNRFEDYWNNGVSAFITRRVINDTSGVTSHVFYVSAQEALSIASLGTTSPSVNTAITREKGDARYAQLSTTNTFSSPIVSTSINTTVTNQIPITIGAGGNRGITGNNTSELAIVIGNTLEAVFSSAAAGLATSAHVVTRQKGDDRYLQIGGSVSASRVFADQSVDTAGAPGFTWQGDSDTGIYNVSNNIVGFAAAGTEVARYTASSLLVGRTVLTGNNDGCYFTVSGIGGFERDSGPAILVNRFGTTLNGSVMEIRRSNTIVGTIAVSGATTNYLTTSDYRLKTNYAPVENAESRIRFIPVYSGEFIDEPGKTKEYFLAHELQDTLPYAVTGFKDAVDENNEPVHQMVDNSKLVPLLTAALQEAFVKIEQLSTTVADLQTQINSLK